MIEWFKALFKPSSPSSSSNLSNMGRDASADKAPGWQARDGILWYGYDGAIALLKDRARPVLMLVMDEDGTRWPFLRELLKALPENKKLCGLLDGPCVALLLKADALPGYLAALGAGSAYHVAVLSPAGFTPLVIFDYVTGNPTALAAEIADGLEKIAPHWA